MTFISNLDDWAEKCVEEPRWAAECLQRIGRFGGQHPTSNVLVHSLSVHETLKMHECPQLRLWALYHDAHEILTGDITRPFKSHELTSNQMVADEVLKVKLGISIDVDLVHQMDVLCGDREAVHWGNVNHGILFNDHVSLFETLVNNIFEDRGLLTNGCPQNKTKIL